MPDARTDSLAEKGFMTVAGVGEFLSVSRPTVNRMMDDGRLPSMKIGRLRRIPRAAVIRLATENLVAATTETESGDED